MNSIAASKKSEALDFPGRFEQPRLLVPTLLELSKIVTWYVQPKQHHKHALVALIDGLTLPESL